MGTPTVIVKQGWLRGANVRSILGQSYISFRGIPYAKPPVGELRFKDPQPLEPWSGFREALKNGPQCTQGDMMSGNVDGSEDCLYLYVATPSLKGSRPVMVWIHGGGFMLWNGNPENFGPDYLLQSDIVFVTINYRLGVLGFLNLDHEAAPGNFGLKDQVAALKWVKENISQFGGDPSNVTIFGESAGAASVHYHLLSPLSKGLFHKAILQSGVALNPWAFVPNPVERAHQLTAELGIASTDPVEIVEYLRTLPAEKIVEAQKASKDAMLICDFPFTPSVDDKSPSPFLPKIPEELLKDCSTSVPMIIGYNSDEGLIALLLGGSNDLMYLQFDEQFHKMIPRNLAARAPSKVHEITTKIRQYYFKDKKISKETSKEFTKFVGSSEFIAGIQAVVEAQQQKRTPTYFYRFSYNIPNSLRMFLKDKNVEGTGHGDDLQFLFHSSQSGDSTPLEPDSDARVVLNRFVRMWTDFARTGNPTPNIDDLITQKWLPVDKTRKNYLEIKEELVPGQNPDDDEWQHWKKIFEFVDGQDQH